MNERQIFVLEHLVKIHKINRKLIGAHLEAIQLHTLAFIFNGYELKKNPWKIRCFYNMFKEKKKQAKEYKVIEKLFIKRVQLRHKITHYRLQLDVDYMEKTMIIMVKRERFEEAAELRDKILLIKNDTVYGHDYTSNNTRQTV